MQLKKTIKSGVLLILGGGLTLAYGSYDTKDESLNTVGGTINNLAGQAGAYIADIGIQSVGYMIWIVIGALLCGGIGLWFGKKIKGRLLLSLPTMVIGCGLFPEQGGLVGKWMKEVPYIHEWWMRGILAILFIGAIIYVEMVPVKKICHIVLIGCRAGMKGIELFLKWIWKLSPKKRGFILLSLFFGTVWLSVAEYVGGLSRGVAHIQSPLLKQLALYLFEGYPYLILGAFILLLVPMAMPNVHWNFKPMAHKWAEWIKTMHRAEKVVEPLKKIKKTKKKEIPQKVEPALENTNTYQLPTVDLLNPAKTTGATITKDAMAQISKGLEGVLAQFGISGRIVGANPGPVVTLYEFEPASGVKTSRVIALSDDIAREMRALSVRIAVVPGSNVIGIEMPNPKRDTVYIRELVESPKFKANTGALPMILGKNIGGEPTYADLAKMPHLLVAGTTGSGKSVAINTMILSLLYRFTPAECRLILVDPKMVELSVYNNIPHLLTPVVTDAPKAVVALKWAVREMEDRYRAMSQLGVRNIDGYNQKLLQAAREGRVLTRRVQTGFDPTTGKPIIEEQPFDLTPIPYIVMIVDEMSDLMGQCGKEAEPPILRLAQMARAVGIHLILATQRPSVDVITGLIKANFPTRISFQVTNKIDSRTILDEQGAEQLLGRGDMLYRPAGSKPLRLHGPFVSDEEVERVVTFWRGQGEPQYVDAVITEPEEDTAMGGGAPIDVGDGGNLYDKAVAIVLRDKKVSTSYIQRQLRIGYNRAADLIDKMEAEGVISKPNIAGKREILVPTDNA
ncbi:MAG: DNA translocase FtsK 4TM domain-containing protein [Pseudomonadota bacterium]|nr:DNA translocase FtsK 4TM domain-containing protein [Pseudomonadota bacterium]